MLKEPQPPFPEQGLAEPGQERKMRSKPRYEGAAYQEAGKLRQKAALITGGDSGIGRSVAVLFAREGADVAIVCLEEEQPDAAKTTAEIQKAGR